MLLHSKRFLISALATVLAVTLVLLPPGYLPTLGAFSPFVALGTLLASRSVAMLWTLIPAGLVLLLMLAGRRVFCRYLCPMGFFLRLIDLFQYKKFHRGKRLTQCLSNVGIVLFVAALVTAFFHGPSLLWLDPFSLFAAAFCMVSFPIVTVPLLLPIGLTLMFPGYWCAKACPLGAMQDVLGYWRATPSFSGRTERDVWEDPDEIFQTSNSARRLNFSRRGAIKVVLGGFFGGLLISRDRLESLRAFAQTTAKENTKGGTKELIIQPFLRPPGAVLEPTFHSLCTRCGSCLRSCPSRVLRPERKSKGLLTPRLVITTNYCREDCANCSGACPTGAIAPFTVEQKTQFPIGVAKLEPVYCLLYENRECEICKRHCPYEAISFKWSEEEYITLPFVDRAKCTGCGRCQTVCPGFNSYERKADPSLPVIKAIRVVQRDNIEA